MSTSRTRAFWLLALVALLLAMVSHANAALYWFQGVRSKTISVCFVGTAVTTRPDRVQQILTYLKEFEYAANIRFNYLGQCPASIPQPDGHDYYDGDIRVMIPNAGLAWTTGPVLGNGCPMTSQPGGSWSNAPNDLGPNRACLYNLRLGDDGENGVPYLNHTLHEFGHALGLSHEHARADENANCVPSTHGEYHIANTGYMTPYDKDSVMHYKFSPTETPSCVQTGSNYSYQGFTGYDKLALHIMYPEDTRVAEYVGTTVVRVGDTLRLQSDWKARGANMNFVATNFVWKLNGITESTTPDLIKTMNVPGAYALSLTYTDFLGRNYSATGTVYVMDAATYTNAAALSASVSPALMTTLFATNLPIIVK
ncbi:MAG TPA: M12 family metallopeptidase [Anaerolineae bacterium]|nr:M12 family metallopeptidase [Anaerolineae bacterium]